MTLHTPVLAAEVLAALDPRSLRNGAVILDGTVGLAGHATLLLEARDDLRLIGIDRDPWAALQSRLALARFGTRAIVENAKSDQIPEVLETHGIASIDALLLDLGVSSPQIDDAARGISLRGSGPLDMRMDPSRGESLLEILQHIGVEDLTEAIRTFGEERRAGALARAICADARAGLLATTRDLAGLCHRIVGRDPSGQDSATRTFQALRILVNDEIGVLERTLASLSSILAIGAPFAVISFHSLEDRPVKRFIEAGAKGCICPPDLPICACGKAPWLESLGKPRRASEDESRQNPRARSAILRAARRIS